MKSYLGSCEIVEAGEDLDSIRHSRGYSSSHSGSVVGASDRKPPMLTQGYKEYLEDDINQLFKALSFKKSSRGLGLSNQSEKGMSPLRKDLMKRPIAASAPHSPRVGSSEPVTLKQALREHCLSKASEMATMKRLSRSSTTLGVSEAERKKGLYSSVVIDTGMSGHHPLSESSRNMFEISLVRDKNESISDDKMHQHLQISKMKSSDRSAQSSPRFQEFQLPIQSAGSSPRFAVPKAKGSACTSLIHNEGPSGYISFQIPKLLIDTGTKSIHNNEIGSASRAIGSKGLKSPTQSVNSSLGLGVPKKENINETEPMQSGTALPSKAETQAVKKSTAQRVKHSLTTSLSYSNRFDNVKSSDRKVTTSTKVGIRLSPSKPGRRGRFHTTHSVLSVVRVSKFRSIQTKAKVKRKPKQGVSSFTASVPIVVSNNSSVPSTKQLICHKCHCTLKNVIEQPDEDSPVSSPGAVVSSDTMYPGAESNFALSDQNTNRTIREAKRNSKSGGKGEFSQSSKSSLCEFSTSTSNSDESNASRTSWSNRPHMSKDFRWQAIRHVKVRDGGLSLDHFNLLKKLGSGDIGTVYLAELIGSNCLFALKVMDIEFLARRKKMSRAQVEREILRMLDHPFLPTLYAQFISDNLSCLVMEYCPGGDLHVLRQKQTARSFPEPAARFYVAEVLLALEYLHMLGIIYRDLKPENILVREDGHIMLTDFDLSLQCSVNPMLLQSSSSSSQSLDPARISGQCMRSSCMQPFCVGPSGKGKCFSRRALPPTTAKARKMKTELAARIRSMPQLVAEPTDARSNSFVGTHEYLAPEIIKGDGHGAAVDWWTFGIFLYELLYGKTPFKGSENDETLVNVVLQSLKFPDTPLVSLQARDLIKRLLVKEPESRLGTEKGAAEIKQHPFFEGLNWALIRCAIPPDIPEFNDIGVLNQMDSQGTDSSRYMECTTTSDHIEFELF